MAADFCAWRIWLQDEKYDHIEAADIQKVEKCLQEKTEVFDKNLHLCSNIKLHENPPITASMIRTHKQVSNTAAYTFHPTCCQARLYLHTLSYMLSG